MLKGFADLADLPEDEQIRLIGEAAMKGGTIGVCVESRPAGKADRYVKKLLERFPELEEMDRGPGPVAGVTLILVRKRRVKT